MTIGTALVLMAIEDDGAGHGGGGGERKAGKERRHRPAAGGSRHEAEALLGWGDGSLAIFSGVAAALADIAFYQVPPRTHLFFSPLADSGVCGVCGSWRGWA